MVKQTSLKRVFLPGRIGAVRIRNRIVRMGANVMMDISGSTENRFSERLISFYEDMAAGGTGLVTVSGGMVKFGGEDASGFNPLVDECIPALAEVAGVIKRQGAAAFFQMLSPYPDVPVGNLAEGSLSLAASDLSQEDLDGLIPFFVPPRAITHDEIRKLVQLYADMAYRAKQAGFDGVEVNAGHVHFLNTFLSPAWNRRTDEYGGDAQGRSRIVCEIVRAIKERCGLDFAVVNLINVVELNLPGGITLNDSIETAKCLEAAGSDAIHCRAEIYHDAVEGITVRTGHEIPDVDLYPSYMGKDLADQGIDTSKGGVAAWSVAAGEIKKHVGIPIICVGRMDAYVADELIGQGKIDFANICRRLLADPDYVTKIESDNHDGVRPCVGCLTCYDTAERGLPAQCMVNAGLLGGRDYSRIQPAERQKRVLVVGGGAAGLEAARVAALRGHDVTIADRSPNLGGSLPMAAFIKDFHEDFLGFSQWQVREIKRLGVKVASNTEVDAAFVERMAPDSVVVAVGGKEASFDVPGADKRIVMAGGKLHDLLQIVNRFLGVRRIGMLSKVFLPIGKNVVIVGGAIHGVQTAAFLMRRGRKVTIVDEGPEIGFGMLDLGPKPRLLEWLKAQGARFITDAKIIAVEDTGLVIETGDAKRQLIAADTVVTALPAEDNLALYEELKGLCKEVYAVGDCNPQTPEGQYPPLMLQPVETQVAWPGFTAAAIRDAYRVARSI